MVSTAHRTAHAPRRPLTCGNPHMKLKARKRPRYHAAPAPKEPPGTMPLPSPSFRLSGARLASRAALVVGWPHRPNASPSPSDTLRGQITFPRGARPEQPPQCVAASRLPAALQSSSTPLIQTTVQYSRNAPRGADRSPHSTPSTPSPPRSPTWAPSTRGASEPSACLFDPADTRFQAQDTERCRISTPREDGVHVPCAVSEAQGSENRTLTGKTAFATFPACRLTHLVLFEN